MGCEGENESFMHLEWSVILDSGITESTVFFVGQHTNGSN